MKGKLLTKYLPGASQAVHIRQLQPSHHRLEGLQIALLVQCEGGLKKKKL